MKKLHATLLGLFASIAAYAQNDDPTREIQMRWNAFQLFLSLLTFAFFAVAIFYFIKMILEDRIKNKLIEKGASDSVVTQLLQPVRKDTKNEIIKWVCILGSGGVGLLFVDHFQPLGIRSIAIIALSLSIGLLAYFFFVRQTDKK
jgi:hypothetical protein